MDRIVRTISGTKRTYSVYTEQEATDDGVKYLYWKDADSGDYAITDDKYVALCINRREYTDKQGRTKTFVKLSCGVGWAGRSTTLLYEPNRAAGVYSYVKPDHWVKKEVRTTRFRNAVAAYVDQVLSNNAIDWDMIGNIYRPNQKTPAATVRRLFKQQEVRQVIDKKLKESLLEKGITQDMMLDLHMEAIDIARKKKDPSNMLRATENLMDLLEMKPGKRVVTESLDYSVTSSIADQIESEEKKLKLAQKIEEPIVEDSREN